MAGRLRLRPVALALGGFLVISYLLDVFLWVLWPTLGTQKIWEVLLPGLQWLSLGHFFLGLGESFLLGCYAALVLVPLYNFVCAREVKDPSEE